ncbi:hypothetical protein C2138_12015 [Salinibacterium hongtaonis]|nr:hypothetical protein C2138_12015 [Salinibacterium hongtaonis]
MRSVGLDFSSTLARCRAYAPLLREGQFFCLTTAAMLYAIPLPRALEEAGDLHIAAGPSGSRPRTTGVRGHRLSPTTAVRLVGGLRVENPVSVWCRLAEVLGEDDLIAAGDYLISGRVGGNRDSGSRDSGGSREQALATLSELRDAVTATAGSRGSRIRHSAISQVRERVDSRSESLLRMLLVRSGLPEPLVNVRAYRADGVPLGRPDLSYVEARVALEYEGDGHRTDVRQFRYDIARRERFEDAGWRVRRVTADDLNRRPRQFVAGVRSLLLARGMQLSAPSEPRRRRTVS